MFGIRRRRKDRYYDDYPKDRYYDDYPRVNSLVKFVPGGCFPSDMQDLYPYPFTESETLLYLGEIVNMPGHVIVVNQEGKVFFGFHPENFVELDEDET